MMTTYKSPGYVNVTLKANIELNTNRSRQTSNEENSNVIAEVSGSKKSKHFPEVSIRPYLTEVNGERKNKGFQWLTEYSQVKANQLSFNNDNSHLVNNNSFGDDLHEENYSVEKSKPREESNKVLEDKNLNQIQDESLNNENEVQVKNIDLKYKRNHRHITLLAISTIIPEQPKPNEQEPEDTSTQKAESNNFDEIKEIYIEIVPNNNLSQNDKEVHNNPNELNENNIKDNEEVNLEVPNNYCDECKLVQV